MISKMTKRPSKKSSSFKRVTIKKTGDAVIDLGNQIIRELGDDRYSDVLTRWMASYIADLIAKAEQADESEIKSLKQECANAILLLWKHRSSWPDRTRPFKELEPLISTLEGLDPDKNVTFYQQHFWERAENQSTPEELKKWLQIAQGVDHIARILIEQALDAAQRIAVSQNIEWVKAALEADDAKGSDVELTIEFISRLGEPELDIERIRSKLEGRLERVDAFLGIADTLRKDIETQLSSLDE